MYKWGIRLVYHNEMEDKYHNINGINVVFGDCIIYIHVQIVMYRISIYILSVFDCIIGLNEDNNWMLHFQWYIIFGRLIDEYIDNIMI